MRKNYDTDDFVYFATIGIVTLMLIAVVVCACFTLIGPEQPSNTEEETVETGNGVSDVIFETYTNALDTTEVDRAEVREINTMNIDEYAKEAGYSDDVKLIAQLVIAEAENQPVLGQELVADVVCNRVEHEKFPNTVKEVIFQPGQFSCVDNGRFAACEDKVDDYMCALVYHQLYERQSWIALYFKTGGYFDFGEPICRIGDHFFSGE